MIRCPTLIFNNFFSVSRNSTTPLHLKINAFAATLNFLNYSAIVATKLPLRPQVFRLAQLMFDSDRKAGFNFNSRVPLDRVQLVRWLKIFKNAGISQKRPLKHLGFEYFSFEIFCTKWLDLNL